MKPNAVALKNEQLEWAKYLSFATGILLGYYI